MTTPPTGRARVPGANPPPAADPYARPYNDGRASVGTGPDYTSPPPGRPKRKIKPRWGRIALVLTGLLVVVALILGISGYAYIQHVNGEFKRVDAFSLVKGQRPAEPTDG